MGFFERLKGLARGTASQVVGELERANPAAVYEAAIDDALARIEEHKQAVAGLAARRDRAEAEIEALEREAERVGAAIAEAVRAVDDDTALVLMARRDELAASLEAKRRDQGQLVGAVEETRRGMAQLREQVKQLKREREVALAQLATAQANVEISETLGGVATSAQARGVESVRSSVAALNARAHAGYLDEDGQPIRARAAALGRKAAEEDARAQLERLKRARSGEPDDSEDPEPPPEVVRKL